MKNFMYHIPTKVHFGKGAISNLPDSIKEYGNKVLLVYGGGSIKKLGIYDEAVKLMNENGIEFIELSGVEPNPRVETADKGAKLCKKHNVEVVLAIGGGSTMDCAKAIAAGAYYDDTIWDFVSGKSKIGKVLPIITIVTLAATGSEMDTSAIITKWETNEKAGLSGPNLRPKVSILDPEYTFSVSKYQTAAGTADIISHVLEVYFNNNPGAFLQSKFCEAVLKTCFKYGHVAYNEPENYEARANLLWSASWAINGLCTKGAPVGWSVHSMEHELSAYYDITHGIGLAILMPHWLRHMLRKENAYKYVEFGVNVLGIDPTLDEMDIANKAIDVLANYLKDMDLPTTLTEVGIDETYFDIMAEKAGKGLANAFIPMDKDDVLAIFKASL